MSLRHIRCELVYELLSEISKTTSCNEVIETLFNLAIDSDFLGCMFVNSATELANRDKEINEIVTNSFFQSENFIEEIIKRGQKNGEFSSSCDSKLLAESIHNSLLGIRVMSRTSTEKEKLNRIAKASMNLLYTLFNVLSWYNQRIFLYSDRLEYHYGLWKEKIQVFLF